MTADARASLRERLGFHVLSYLSVTSDTHERRKHTLDARVLAAPSSAVEDDSSPIHASTAETT